MKRQPAPSPSLREQTRQRAHELRTQAIGQMLTWLWRHLRRTVRAVVQPAAVSPTARNAPHHCH